MGRANAKEKHFRVRRLAAPPEPRRCDVPGCACTGEFRAPKSRDELRDYYWFCLDHVRAYNRAWNYLAGMNDDEVEAVIRSDTTWNRPSWPFGRVPPGWASTGPRFTDGFGGIGPGAEDPASEAGRRWEGRATAEQREAMSVMGLEPPPELEKIKSQYKKLVKRHHPDANGGDTSAEDQLKQINRAYAVLLSCVASKSAM